MPTNPARILPRVFLSACFLALLPGCLPDTEPVQVRLNNQSQQDISARIVHARGMERQTLSRRTIRADQTESLGPIPRPSGGSLTLELELLDKVDSVLRTPLGSGLTSYRVVRPTFSAKGPLELRSETSEQEWTYSRGFIPNSRRTADQP